MAGSDPAAWRALHPASVVVNLLPTVWRAVRSMWPLLLAVLWGGRDAQLAWFELSLLAFLLGSPILRTILHWATLRYRVADGRLEITSGLLNRQARVIPPERIQNVELVRNVFHRASGLVELRVETASGSDPEGMLSALSVGEATRLMDALEAARQGARPVTEEVLAEQPLVDNGVSDLLWYGLTTTRLSLAVVAMGVLYEGLLASDPERMSSTASTLGLVGSVAILVTLLLGSWLVGAAMVLVRHWGFRLARRGDRLTAEEGLFTRRRVELTLGKVQLVTVHEPLVRRLLGFGSLAIETAAVREGEGGTQTAEAVVPVLPSERNGELVRVALPDAPDLDGLPLSPPHPRAVRRALVATAVRTSLLAGFLTWLLWPWGLLAGLFVPASLFGTWLDHRMQGWWVGPRHIVSRTGWWVRSTRIVAREKLQSLELVQGPIARRWDLARLVLRVAGSRVALPMLAFEDALELEIALSGSVSGVVVVVPEGREPLPRGLEHHRDVGHEQGPRDGLRHDAHEQQGREQHPLPSGPSEGEPHGGADGEQGHAQHEHGGDPEHLGQRGHPPVEPQLPDDRQAHLDEHGEGVEDQHRADDGVQRGDDGSQPRVDGNGRSGERDPQR